MFLSLKVWIDKMTYSTEIDTVSIQIDCSSLEVQQGISFMIIRSSNRI